MLYNRKKRVSSRPVTAASYLVFIALASCAKAADPELFRADPNLFDDQTLSLPTTGSSGGFNYEIIQGFAVFEGDILLGKVDHTGSVPQKLMPRGLGRSDAFGRWPDGIVPYQAPTDNSTTQQDRIAQAIEHWTANTNISFVERTSENQDQYPNYLRFDSSNSCASYVGMQGGGQSVLVSDACSTGSIIHEIGHALGLFHEHTRPDRDNFAQINWDEIVAGKEINFDILEAGVENFGPYDYGSIMHYGEYFFSATGLRTITVPDGISIGQRTSLSDLDASAINEMYATDLALFEPTLNTVASGLEIGISIANQGQLGANQLELVATADAGSQWQGISQESDWNCTSIAAELTCTRDTLSEQSESRFTLLLNPATEDNNLSLTLSSRTGDTDLSNNTFNDIVTEPTPQEPADQPTTTPTPEPTPTTTPTTEPTPAPVEETPALGAASGGAASAGSENGAIAIIAGMALLWQRRRRLAIKDAH